MKKIRYCKITILILAGWAILSAIGFLGKDTIYSRYTVNPVKTPYFVLVMQGIHDGIYPWSSDHESLWDKWEEMRSRSPRLRAQYLPQRERRVW